MNVNESKGRSLASVARSSLFCLASARAGRTAAGEQLASHARTYCSAFLFFRDAGIRMCIKASKHLRHEARERISLLQLRVHWGTSNRRRRPTPRNPMGSYLSSLHDSTDVFRPHLALASWVGQWGQSRSEERTFNATILHSSLSTGSCRYQVEKGAAGGACVPSALCVSHRALPSPSEQQPTLATLFSANSPRSRVHDATASIESSCCESP